MEEKLMKNKIISVFIPIISLIIIGVGCGNAENANGSNGNMGDTLNVAINENVSTLDPHMTTAAITRDVSMNVYETLVTINSDVEPEPMLAESRSEERRVGKECRGGRA